MSRHSALHTRKLQLDNFIAKAPSDQFWSHYHPHQALMGNSPHIVNLDLTVEDYMLSQCIESARSI